MSKGQLRDMTTQELVEHLAEAKKEKFNLRFQIATNQLDNTARLGEVKRDIARTLTMLRERELAEDAESFAEESA